jgi:cytochrome bd-type quinol oxidase subunit 2
VPYYTLAVGAIFGHLAAVHHRKRQNRARASREAQALLLGGFVLGLLIVLGFTNYFRGVEMPPATTSSISR